ncbi:MAG: Orotate phosphoribosyltransferase [Candidatus Saccharicenans subterraneus]|uniref:Orotate phosphoribosyltransferase n=1 Tax=Candidatus Saccharicenans subterraneus TaxID=2508984 RepID=A0A3E2BLU1_9BACT|nr:MAG: Orotate phosphoribosyltransferase [Candidatus Saccharicenans subterraneum]
MPENRSEMILNLFKESQALLKGHFKLTSGKHSDVYFEKIKLIERPAVLEKIIDLLVEEIQKDNPEFDYVVSPAYGGIAIGFLTALKLNKLFAFSQRVEEKMTVRSGFAGLPGQRAIIVEDILTTGGSVQEVLECLKSLQVTVNGIYCLVDRSAGQVLIEGKPVRSLLALKVSAYEPESCPLCQQGLPLVKPGASDKK